MGAIIVQCPSCQARFHLAQERIPEKGARVRCSRCEHRFYVTSTGDVSQSKPRKAKSDSESGPQTGAGASSGSQSASSLDLSSSGSTSGSSTGGSSQPPRRAPREVATTVMDAMREPPQAPRVRSAGPVAPEEDTDLDDPQFLFDDTQSSELPYTPGALDDEEPSSAALGDLSGRARAARAPDTDVTPPMPEPAALPEEPEPAAEPEPPAIAPGASESWLSNDDEAIPDIRAQRDELALGQSLSEPSEAFELTGSSSTPERAPESTPPLPAASSVRTEVQRPAPREEAAPEAPPGRYAGAGSTVLVARSAPERAARDAAPPLDSGPLSASIERASMLVSVLTALALIFSGWHVMREHLSEPGGPERVRIQSGEISSVEVLQLRDAEGHRVLAVRGLLQTSNADRPRVQLRLLDAAGSELGTPHLARPGFLRDVDLASDRLGALLAPEGVPLASGDLRGFTVLVRDPPLEAARFALELAG